MKYHLNLPNFNISTENLPNSLKQLLASNTAAIAELAKTASPTWDNLLQPLDDLQDKIQHFWSPVHHLHAVMNSPTWRSEYEASLALLTDYQTHLGQNRNLFELIQKLTKSKIHEALTQAQQKILENHLRDFHLSGVDFSPEQQIRYQEIVQRLSELSTQFENNIIDSTQAWHYHTEDETLLKGLPHSRLVVAKSLATEKNMTGWWLGLDHPTYFDVITFADSRKLREIFYKAYQTRASDQDVIFESFNNEPIIEEILALRDEQAKLLSFNNYSELSLATKMADSPEHVEKFLLDLIAKVRPQAEKELAELAQGFSELAPWDLAYYSEKLRETKFSISEEELRPYFPLETVLTGVFAIIKKLWNIDFIQNTQIKTWHNAVKYYDLIENGTIVGGIYCDFFARDNKRSGAWMDDAVSRRLLSHNDIQLPVAFLVCNIAPPTSETPSLLMHDDVVTLFHELGHCLQHLLTKINYRSAAGISGVPWDAVEFPSQFFESWAWQPESLAMLSGHYKTGEKLPNAMLQNLIAAKNFQSALFLLRQLEFALYDLRLHCAIPKKNNARVILAEVRKLTGLLTLPDYHRFQNSFSHIFAGGYAAGYYSYLWAEVLARDAFSAFEQQGLFNAELALRFRNTVLGLGGSVDANQVFVEFMRRAPEQEALLKYHGIK